MQQIEDIITIFTILRKKVLQNSYFD